MDAYTTMYNDLPTLGEADANFVNRNTIFSQLVPLLARFDFRYGVCLVHSHCKLEEGERMIGQGNVCQPADPGSVFHYPARWLANGTAFEFTTEATSPPPDDLLTEFRRVIGDITILGLYFSASTPSDDFFELEHTEGRANITNVVPRVESNPANIETAWLPGTKNPTTMACRIFCDTLNTRGGTGYHKNTKSHEK